MRSMKNGVIYEFNRSCSCRVSRVRSLALVYREVLAADVAIRLTRLMKASSSHRSLIFSVSDWVCYMEIVLSKRMRSFIIPGTRSF